MRRTFLPGIDVLLSRHRSWLKGKRVGLVSHAAAVDASGRTTAERLWRDTDVDLACILAPEHGFLGMAGAGVACRSRRHPDWRIPVFSLYGARRSPSARMLRLVDLLVVDLQDIGARPYTYVSTLFHVLEAAAAARKPVIVADRPVPLPCVTDGPVTEQELSSFVARARLPLVYGMTPGETALWIVREYGFGIEPRVARMRGYARDDGRRADWPPWLPPSPGIRSWESAMCFPATVIFEALPHIDHGRRTNLPFQVFGAAWTRGDRVAAALESLRLPGICFYAHRYDPDPWCSPGATLHGVRMVVTAPARFRPARTAVAILEVLVGLYGPAQVFRSGAFRPDWFDKLMGTDSVRLGLQSGQPRAAIAASWTGGLRAFGTERRACLLYARGGAGA